VGVCNWIFLQHNCYLFVPTMNLCCLAVPEIEPTPPNWIDALNHTYIGIDTYVGEPAYHWTFVDGDNVTHTYYQRVSNPAFPFAMVGHQDNTYDALEFFDSEMVEMFRDGTFELPSAACATACPPIFEADRPKKLAKFQ